MLRSNREELIHALVEAFYSPGSLEAYIMTNYGSGHWPAAKAISKNKSSSRTKGKIRAAEAMKKYISYVRKGKKK